MPSHARRRRRMAGWCFWRWSWGGDSCQWLQPGDARSVGWDRRVLSRRQEVCLIGLRIPDSDIAGECLDIGAVVAPNRHISTRRRCGIWFDVKSRRLDEAISLAFILDNDGAVLQLKQDAVAGYRKAGRGVFVESDLVCRQQLNYRAASCPRRNGVAIINPPAAGKWLSILSRSRGGDGVANYLALLLRLPRKSRRGRRYLGEEPLSKCVAFTRTGLGNQNLSILGFNRGSFVGQKRDDELGPPLALWLDAVGGSLHHEGVVILPLD